MTKKNLFVTALVAGVAALAISNRDKIAGLIKKDNTPEVPKRDFEAEFERSLKTSLKRYGYEDIDGIEEVLADNHEFVNSVITACNGDFSTEKIVDVLANRLLDLDRDIRTNLNNFSTEEKIDKIIVPLADKYLDLSAINDRDTEEYSSLYDEDNDENEDEYVDPNNNNEHTSFFSRLFNR